MLVPYPYTLKARVSVDLGFPPEDPACLLNGGLPHLWIVFGKVSENDLAPAFCQRNDFLSQIENRYFILATKVHRGVLARKEQAVNSLNKIGDVAEASGLAPVRPVHGPFGCTYRNSPLWLR